jgi:hypothetical protein
MTKLDLILTQKAFKKLLIPLKKISMIPLRHAETLIVNLPRLLMNQQKRSRSSLARLKMSRKQLSHLKKKPRQLLSLFQEVKKKLRNKKRKKKKRKKLKNQLKLKSQPAQSLSLLERRVRHPLENQLLQQFQLQSQRKRRSQRKVKSQSQCQSQSNRLLSRRRSYKEMPKMRMRMMVSQLKYLSLKSQVVKHKSQRKLPITLLPPITPE